MRVAHVTDTYLPTLGGIELHVHDLADHQRAWGHDARIVTRTVSAGSSDPDHVLRVDPRRPAWLARVQPDLVHAHISWVSPFALRAARDASHAGIPTVVTVHSMLDGLGGLAGKVGRLFGLPRWPVTWTAVSEAAARPVRELLGVRVSVLPNAVDLDRWRPPPLAPDGPPRVVAVMRLTRVKRALPLARILREVARETEVRASILGDGPERAALAAYLRRHRLDEVRLLGAVDRETVRRELGRAAVFVAPAHRESFGIAALEARASGLPVVASARSGVSSFIGHGEDGLLGRTDDEITAHLVRLLSDADLRHRIATHNRTLAPPCSWEDASVRLATVYEEAGQRLARA